MDKLRSMFIDGLLEKPVSSATDDPDRDRFMNAVGPAAGMYEVKEDTQVQMRRARNVETRFVRRVLDVCVQNILIRACWLKDVRVGEGAPIQLFIALDLAAPDKDLPPAAAKFQAMLKEFPARAPKTFILSSDSLDLTDRSTAVYVKR